MTWILNFHHDLGIRSTNQRNIIRFPSDASEISKIRLKDELVFVILEDGLVFASLLDTLNVNMRCAECLCRVFEKSFEGRYRGTES